MRSLCSAALLVTMIATGASASSVHQLITGEGVAVGATDPAWTLIDPTGDPATPFVVTGHSNWRDASDFGSAEWLSPAETATTAVADGDWVYSLTLHLEAGTWTFDGDYSSDNIVKEIRLVNGTSETLVGPIVPQGSSNPDEQFRSVVELDEQTVIAADGEFQLQFVVHNTENYGGSPSGLIVNGTATMAPVPAAAWGGLALFGGLGGVAGLKRKLRRG
jgi:hypothetical protein